MRPPLISVLLGCSLILGPALASDIDARIIGGCDSAESGHDWMVAVALKLDATEFNSQFCGATLVHESWAITAAHCLFRGQKNTPLQEHQLELYIGATVLDSGQGAHHNVSEIYVHPSYDSVTSFNDIALLKLATPSSLAPARLATIKPGADLDALTVGWGVTTLELDSEGFSQKSKTLQEVNITTFDNADCYSGLLNSQICAGELSGGEDSCAGDSGGPLLLSSRGQDTLIGVVSYGFSCAQPGNLGVYTSVPSYLSWIAETTRDASTNNSDIPLPTVYSESYGDFTSVCQPKIVEPVEPPLSRITGGGSTGLFFFLTTLLGLSRRFAQSNPKANNKKA